MKQWTRTRKLSFVIHVGFVAIPFLASSVSAFLLWWALFDSWMLALPMVAVIDVLALTGLVLFVARIPSPFVPLRRLLPFVSIIPLGRELYLLLAHNGVILAALITLLVTGILTAIAWQCFTTIEELFIPPVEAAREKAREQLGGLSIELAQLTEKNTVVRDFVLAWEGQHQGVTAAAVTPAPRQEHPSLSDILAGVGAPDDSESETGQELSLIELLTTERTPDSTPPSKTQQVTQLARALGVSESTIWRKVKAGEIELSNGRH